MVMGRMEVVMVMGRVERGGDGHGEDGGDAGDGEGGGGDGEGGGRDGEGGDRGGFILK